MAKRKKKMFRCVCCGFLNWETRLETSHYPLELVEVKSEGRNLIKHVFFDWDTHNTLHPVFERHFYHVLEYLLRHKYLDAGTVKKLGEIFMKAPDVFHPDVVFDPEVVYEPDVIFNPKVIK